MKTLNLQQGTPEWHAHRDTHYNASDAPAMMNCSLYETRADLIKRLATGIKPEVDAGQQQRFDDGHRFEALCRPYAEEIIGQKLYPVTGSEDEGKLSASFDGLPMDDSVPYEHKTLNNQLRQVMVDGATGADLAIQYRVQMEQQCMVSGAKKVLFMASKWQNDALVEKRHVWYESDPALAEQIRAGWEQLEKDVAAYQPVAVPEKVIAEPIEALPALSIQVRGDIALISNLPVYKEKADSYLDTIKYDLVVDEDFVNADAVGKFCGEVEAGLKRTKEGMLSQTISVFEAITFIDLYIAKFAKARNDLGNKVKIEKQSRRDTIIVKARADFSAHVAGLNNELAPLRINAGQPDFDTAAKGLKTLASIQNKVDAAMAQGKIAADSQAKDVRSKVAWFKEAAAGHEILFADLQVLIAKPPEDFQLTVKTRVDQHKTEIEAQNKLKEDEQKAQANIDQARKDEALPAPVLDDLAAAATHVRDEGIAGIGARQAINAAQRAPSAPLAAEVADLRIGTINERLGFSVTADFLLQLGFEPTPGKGPHRFYRASQFPAMCHTISTHVLMAADAHHEAAAY